MIQFITKLFLCFLILSSCTKDRDINTSQNPISTSGDFYILSIWDFNQETSKKGLLEPVFSFDFATLHIESSQWDVTDGTILNSFDETPAGNSLRVRNPSEYLDIKFSTKGYGDINISYASMRTNNGSKKQKISYSIDGLNFSQFGLQPLFFEPITEWSLYEINMQTIPSIFDRDSIIVRISFLDGNTGESGNNRFDNIIIKGRKLSN